MFIDNEFSREQEKGVDFVGAINNGILMSGNITSTLLQAVSAKGIKLIPKSSLKDVPILG